MSLIGVAAIAFSLKLQRFLSQESRLCNTQKLLMANSGCVYRFCSSNCFVLESYQSGLIVLLVGYTDAVDLLKRPMRDLRISVTDRCNFRCSYCMPLDEYRWIQRQEVLSFEEIEHTRHGRIAEITRRRASDRGDDSVAATDMNRVLVA